MGDPGAALARIQHHLVTRRPGDPDLTGAWLRATTADWSPEQLLTLAHHPATLAVPQLRMALPDRLAVCEPWSEPQAAALQRWFMAAARHRDPVLRRQTVRAVCASGASLAAHAAAIPVGEILAADPVVEVRDVVATVLLARVAHSMVIPPDRPWAVEPGSELPLDALATIHLRLCVRGLSDGSRYWFPITTLALPAPLLASRAQLDALVLGLAAHPDARVPSALLHRLAGLVPFLRRATLRAVLERGQQHADACVRALLYRNFAQIWTSFELTHPA